MVRPEAVQAFLDPLPVRKIRGIGPKTEAFLHEQGIRTVGELRELPEPQLVEWFGKWGRDLFRKVRGIADSPVSNEWVAKSMGEQETFERDTRSPSFLIERLYGMVERTIARLQEEGYRGFRTITLTVRFADFQTRSRSCTFEKEVALGDEVEALQLLKQRAGRLLLPFLDVRENPERKAIRLVGLRLEKLSQEGLRSSSFPADRHHRAGSKPDHTISDAPHEELRESRAAMRPDHDQVRAFLPCQFHNPLVGLPLRQQHLRPYASPLDLKQQLRYLLLHPAAAGLL